MACSSVKGNGEGSPMDAPGMDISGDSPADAAINTRAQQAYIKASNTGAGDGFGYSITLSGDGSTRAVGGYGEASAAVGVGGNQADNSAPGAGAVYVSRAAV